MLLEVIVPPTLLSETPDASCGFQQLVVGRLPARMFPGSGPRYKSPQKTEGQEDGEEQRVFKNALGQATLVLEKVAEAVTTLEAHSPIATADTGGDARTRKELLQAMRDLLAMSFESWGLKEVLDLRAQTKAGG